MGPAPPLTYQSSLSGGPPGDTFLSSPTWVLCLPGGQDGHVEFRELDKEERSSSRG